MNSERIGESSWTSLCAASSAFSRFASSSVGPMMITLSWRRLSRPLVRSTMSSAWSQGTFCRRRVRLPVTESLTTMFWPLVSASSCSTDRTSMSWKFRVKRSPVYSFFSSAAARFSDGLISTVY